MKNPNPTLHYYGFFILVFTLHVVWCLSFEYFIDLTALNIMT
jgi:hypothetical protein